MPYSRQASLIFKWILVLRGPGSGLLLAANIDLHGPDTWQSRQCFFGRLSQLRGNLFLIGRNVQSDRHIPSGNPDALYHPKRHDIPTITRIFHGPQNLVHFRLGPFLVLFSHVSMFLLYCPRTEGRM